MNMYRVTGALMQNLLNQIWQRYTVNGICRLNIKGILTLSSQSNHITKKNAG